MVWCWALQLDPHVAIQELSQDLHGLAPSLEVKTQRLSQPNAIVQSSHRHVEGEHWETALSCPVLCSGPQWGIPLTSQAMWTLVSIHPHTGYFPECVPYCIFCHPGGPEVPPSKTVPKVGDLGQHGLDLEKDPVCP